MEETTFKEAVLAEYIIEVQNWPKDKLLQELLDLKCRLLELSSVSAIIIESDEQRPRNN